MIFAGDIFVLRAAPMQTPPLSGESAKSVGIPFTMEMIIGKSTENTTARYVLTMRVKQRRYEYEG